MYRFKVNNGCKSAIIESDLVEIFQGISLYETAQFAFCNGLAIRHGFSDIIHIKVNIGRQFNLS